MKKFKVGDRIRVKDTDNVRAYGYAKESIGKEFVLTEEDLDGYHLNNNQYGCNYLEDDFELVEDTPKPKFKIGDVLRNKKTLETITIIRISGKDIETTEEQSSSCANWTEDYLWENFELVEEGCNSCEEDIGDFVGTMCNGTVEVYKDNEPSNSSGNKVGNTMSKLTSFVKNSLLSADEKLLRKYDLKDSCGDYTSEARELVIAKMIQDNEDYLIKVATELEAEEKKNK